MEYLNEDNFNNKEEAERVKTVLEYNYSTDKAEDLNKFDKRLGEVAYRKFGVRCGTQEINKRYRRFEQWLDLYNTPTVKEKGRLVSIPEDRPRERGTYWGIEWGAPSWKSEEPLYELTYINHNAYDQIKYYDEISKPNDEFMGMARSEVYGIDRYWIAVGPRVMDEKYPYTGEDIQANKIKYGTMIDVILRDSSYNTYFVPAIVGDIKTHTLDGKFVKVSEENPGIIPKANEPKNGIYQTGVSWADRKINIERDGMPNGAVVEFIRNENAAGIPDNMTSTAEFDILGLIVYDDSVSNYTINSEANY